MNKYNEQGLEHGQWEDYYFNGKLYSRVNFVHGKNDGLSEWYTYDGDINLRHLEFFL